MTRRAFALSLAAGALRGDSAIHSRGREIADKAIEALGGNAFRNLRTRTETGRASSFYHERLSSLSNARFCTKYLPLSGANAGVHQVQRQFYGKKQDDSVLLVSTSGCLRADISRRPAAACRSG